MQCAGAQPVTVDGDVRHDGNRYEGKSRMQTQGMQINSSFSARRLVNC
jgi:hypothetical protein